MTDTSFSVKPINGPDLSHASHASLAAYHQAARNPIYHAPAHVEIPEDDGQISCICGYADDDGWTVACDSCNKWQHQICYYPGYEERTLPEELQHYCIECRPRANIDIEHARQRQREKRKHPEPLTNGVKRTAAKSHKKKIKEPTVALPNGLHDKIRYDRNSASPRDQPPPAKRPKTNHRTSDSTTITTASKGQSRKRGASTVNGHRRSLSRSPDQSFEQYSEEFLQCYMDDEWRETKINLHNSIPVSNALSAWLNALDDEFRDMHHQAKGEVLMRWDGKLEDIPGKAQIEIQQRHDDNVQYDGRFPTWQIVTVRDPVASGAYIGELKGHVGFKEEYQQDPTNRWEQLRHPEPFVFFHPQLPIVIDARNEGTDLRFVRRSCEPNAKLQILVTDGSEYHFCFMATQHIEPGEEVAVGWDTGNGLPELASRTAYSDKQLEMLRNWVSTALANCGPCACSRLEGECMMSRFDRRIKGAVDGHASTKAPKGKKRKAQHISPINTHALNSRSGSEARKPDPDDDGSESRSTSGSAGRGSASREITPNTLYSSNGQQPLVMELSERERKKLAKEEEIFRRQEEEQAGKQAKKKRNSAGSVLNTPSASSSRQLGFPPLSATKYVDAGTSRQSGLPTKPVLGRKSKVQKQSSRPSDRLVRRPKPAYVESSTQCDLENEEHAQRAPAPSSQRPYVSTRQRLLDLCARNNAAAWPTNHSAAPSNGDLSADQDNVMAEGNVALKPEPLGSPISRPAQVQSVADVADVSSSIPPAKDIEMEDAPSSEHIKPEATAPVPGHLLSGPGNNEIDAATSMRTSGSSVLLSRDGTTPRKSHEMHIPMPPPVIHAISSNDVTPLTGAYNLASGSMIQSPSILGPGPGPLLSPSVAAERTPAAKTKKLSLSDYAARRKAKDRDNETKTDRESSPASVASGPIVPPLQASSSAEARAAEGGSAIDDDVTMEDPAHEAVSAA